MFGKKTTLTERLDALQTAADLGHGYLSSHEQEAITGVTEQAAQRRELSGSHTVVGFFGATGSGKTSLFNAVVGEDLGKAAARRPTTSSPLAAIWEPEGSEELLDWLQVEDRRMRTGTFHGSPLILLDLPDFDSVEPKHRAVAERLAGQVDVLVWVTDPEKYADSVIHDEFIRPHASHSSVTLAVLNKADKLTKDDARDVARSFHQLLIDDGLSRVRVIPTSAKTGAGVEELRKEIARVAQSHVAQEKRIAADIDTITQPWAEQKVPGDVPRGAKKELDTYLAKAAGADSIANVTAAAYRKRLGQKTGWLLTSWIPRFRADPLKRLGLREEADELGVHRSSMPALDASSRAVANKGVRTFADTAAQGLPTSWSSALFDHTEEIVDDLPDQLDRAVARTELPAQPGKGWGIFTFFQWIGLLAALVGVLWYLVIAFLPGVIAPIMEPRIPEVEGWPVPTLLILTGLLVGLVLGLFTGAFGWAIGAGIKNRTKRAIRNEVAEISEDTVVAPLMEIRNRYISFLEAMKKAAS